MTQARRRRFGIISCTTFMSLHFTVIASATDLDCENAGGGDRYTVEQCASLDLQNALAAQSETMRALASVISVEDRERLQVLQRLHVEYQRQYCDVFTEMAAQGNEAWALTWKNIAQDACRADMLVAHQERLEQLLRVTNNKASQRAGFSGTGEGKLD